MMAVFVVILIIFATEVVVIRMAFMMILIVGMKARGSQVLSHVTMHARHRRPGKLERNDQHDDQGDEAAHGRHSTEVIR